MARVAVIGAGVVGARVARRLPTVVRGAEVVPFDPRSGRPWPSDIDVAVLAHGGAHAPDASWLLDHGVAVVSVSDDLADVRALADLDHRAVAAGVPVVVGAGMDPGLTGLLARLLASKLASCDEIHLAIHGTAGPACARQQHRALGGRAVGLQDRAWIRHPAGSGRELCYFPEPVGPYDCYRAELASPVLLHEAFPDAVRISARVSANRRDRFTAWLPMLSPPHREGGVGAIRVEVRGADESGGRVTLIAGVAELVATATAASAIAFTAAAVSNGLRVGAVRAGDADLDTVQLLHTVGQAGVRLQEYTGVSSTSRISANP
ncbi:MAG: hypothetical protein WBL31_18350 [Ilumatobacteraceae bacterium]|jgi:hypothetical protein